MMKKLASLFSTVLRRLDGGLSILWIMPVTAGLFLGAATLVWAGAGNDALAGNGLFNSGFTSTSETFTEVLTDSRSLDGGGKLNILNIDGNIQVRGSDKEEVSLVAEKRVQINSNPFLPSCPTRDPQALLESIRIDISGDENEIMVETVLEEIGDDEQCVARWVDYDATLPRQAVVDLNNLNGDVFAADIEGRLFINNSNGEIQTDDVQGEQEITLKNGGISVEHPSVLEASERITAQTNNGSITVALPAESAFDFTAEVTVGTIAPGGFPVDVQQNFLGARADNAVGGGGALVDLTVSVGEINLEATE